MFGGVVWSLEGRRRSGNGDMGVIMGVAVSGLAYAHRGANR